MNKTLFMALAIVGAANAFAWNESFDTGPAGFVGAPGTDTDWGNFGDENMAFASGTWVANNRSVPVGATGVFCNTAVFPTHSGAGMANMNFSATTGTNTINVWLMSHVVTVNAGDRISFWSRTVDSVFFPDRLNVWLSNTGAATAEAGFLAGNSVANINPGLTTTGYPSVWTQYTYVHAGASVTGRIGFNYNVTGGGPSGSNSDFIGIDDVSLDAVPEPATMAALGLGVAALLRRRRK